MANNISLTAGMRQNLTALQNIDKLTQTTQNRLATGKKINSALDDPVNYFKANDHYNRANDLEAKKDGMSEAMKTIEAANTGIEKMESLLNQMKSLASAARTSTNATDLESQFDTIMSQLSDLAGDASYGGQNLVSNQLGKLTTLTVDFNEDNTSQLAVTGFNVTMDGTSLTFGTTTRTLTDESPEASSALTALGTALGSAVTALGAASTAIGSSNAGAAGAASTAALAASTAASNATAGNISVNDAIAALKTAQDALTTAGGASGITPAGATAASTAASTAGSSAAVAQVVADQMVLSIDSADFSNEAGISKAINSIDGFISQLRTEAQKLSSSLSTISIRSDFTQAMVNTLNTGADNLTLADMNEEGANMLMLQTRQNLSTTALSLASQAAQAVLQLF